MSDAPPASLSTIATARHHVGAKMALLCDGAVAAYRRDAFPHIPDPGLWDLAGGLREPGETALDCALRETAEEFGIAVPPALVVHAAEFPAVHTPGGRIAFFGARIGPDLVARIVFGDEGQYWRMMPVAEFLCRRDAIPGLQAALRGFAGDGRAAPVARAGPPG